MASFSFDRRLAAIMGVAGLAAAFFVLPSAAQNIGEIMNEAEGMQDAGAATLSGTEGEAVGEVPEVTVEDVEEAGFTAVEIVPEEENKYQKPVYYFRVGETVFEDFPAWGEAANLVAVTIKKIENKELLLSAPRAIQYNQIYGRFQARFTKAGRYIVVTGPEEQKVANLAKLIEAKDFED